MSPRASRRRILTLFPTTWDVRQLDACRSCWAERYEVRFADPADADCQWDLDIRAFIERAASGGLGEFDAVFSSSDYPGATAAAAIATRLGLPGSRPERVLRCSHKYYSRLAQREVAPEATAEFRLVGPDRPLPADLEYPCFVKPVKGAFSIMSGRMDSPAELEAFISSPAARDFLGHYVAIFNELVREYTEFEVDGRAFLAEEYLPGRQATVEGFVAGDEPRLLGIVDSVFHPGVPCFSRFDFPSSLDGEVQARMWDIGRRVIRRLGLRDTMFNIEMNWDPATGRVHIIEVNPRMAGQFADLYEKVLGTNGYRIALALAAGDPLPDRIASAASGRSDGRYACASSVPLRVFRPCRVAEAPTPERLRELEARIPGLLVWAECGASDTLDAFEVEDGHSARYAVVNLGGESPAHLEATLERVVDALGYRFEAP